MSKKVYLVDSIEGMELGFMKQKKAVAWILLWTLFIHLFSLPVQARDQDELVRVALFIDTGKGYRGTVPVITVESQQAFKLMGDKDTPIYQGKALESFRVSPDAAYLLIRETAQLIDAQRITQQLSQSKITCEIIIRGDRFQVVSGPYLNLETMETAKRQIEQSIAFIPVVKGTYRLDIGKFANLTEALAKATELAGKGLEAQAVIPMDSSLGYRVWIGNEETKQSLIPLKEKLKTLVAADTIQETSLTSPYVLVRESAYSPETIYHFYFSPNTTMQAQPSQAEGTLKIMEREGRVYRGNMEFSVYNQAFSLINELPLEHYLYSVVGSEMGYQGWPMEALKAQAILARTRVIGGGKKYGIAHLSDTVYDQAYYGVSKESPDTRKAVSETANLIVQYHGKPIETLYYSNAGGQTAEGAEVWGNNLPYIATVESMDELPEQAASKWYWIGIEDGQYGFVRSDYISPLQEKNPAGFDYGKVNTQGLNFRSGPSTAYHTVLNRLDQGEKVAILAEVAEDNAYSWSRGPYTAEQIRQMLELGTTVTTLEVSQRGPSGRVVEMKANGTTISVKNPDAYRSLFNLSLGSLRSTLFDVVETGGYTILGANGAKIKRQVQEPLSVLTGAQKQPEAMEGATHLAIGKDHQANVLTKDYQYRFVGRGFGHGMGLSQYGAKMMAVEGYDYTQILSHYYQGILIEPY